VLFSIVLSPKLLDPCVTECRTTVRFLTDLLKAIKKNGLLVCRNAGDIRTGLATLASDPRSCKDQKFGVLATELAKEIGRYCVPLPVADQARRDSAGAYANCVMLAKSPACDGVIVLDDEEKDRCIREGVPAGQVILLEQFEESKLGRRRLEWTESQRLDTLPPEKAKEIVARSVRFCDRITVVDKMIGVATKQSASNLRRHLLGVMYVVDRWRASCPDEHRCLSLEIVTVAGSTGAKSGYLDPSETERCIMDELMKLDASKCIGHLKITLKRDEYPSIFNDRLLYGARRAWAVHHGFDDFGRLSANSRSRGMRPTRIDPASISLLTIYRDITRLPDAQTAGAASNAVCGT
jgi:hypothetical protein